MVVVERLFWDGGIVLGQLILPIGSVGSDFYGPFFDLSRPRWPIGLILMGWASYPLGRPGPLSSWFVGFSWASRRAAQRRTQVRPLSSPPSSLLLARSLGRLLSKPRRQGSGAALRGPTRYVRPFLSLPFLLCEIEHPNPQRVLFLFGSDHGFYLLTSNFFLQKLLGVHVYTHFLYWVRPCHTRSGFVSRQFQDSIETYQMRMFRSDIQHHPILPLV